MTDEEMKQKSKEFAKEFCKKCCDRDRQEETCGGLCTTIQCREDAFMHGLIIGLEAGREEVKSQWHDCFLSCSSPYCAGHFRDVKIEGELGNMTKRDE